MAKEIVDAAYRIHMELGPGLLEKVYEVCFCNELAKKGLIYQRPVDVPIVYDSIKRIIHLYLFSCLCSVV